MKAVFFDVGPALMPGKPASKQASTLTIELRSREEDCNESTILRGLPAPPVRAGVGRDLC
jgi:hypothetical protein